LLFSHADSLDAQIYSNSVGSAAISSNPREPYLDVDYFSVSGYSNLNAYIASIGNSLKTLIITSECPYVGDIVTPNNLTIISYPPAAFIGSGTLTINGPFQGSTGCFSKSKHVSGLKEAMPDYWNFNEFPGTTDMSSAWQAAINAAHDVKFNANKVYAISENIWIPGCHNIIGSNTTIVLNGTPTNKYVINLGSSGYGEVSSPFSGHISGFNFIANPSIQTQEIFLALNSADGVFIHDNVFITNGTMQNKAIGGITNTAYVPFPKRRDIYIFNNKIVGSFGDGEVIGFDYTTNLHIYNNHIIDSYDDIGVHKCRDVWVIGNRIDDYNGRIYIADTYNALVQANKITYSKEPGMGIWVGVESTANPHICTKIKVINNEVHHQAGLTATAYGISIFGVRDSIIMGNTMTNSSSLFTTQLFVNNGFVAGWQDPTNIDTSNTPSNRNVIISNNIIDGVINISGGKQIIVNNNIAGTYVLPNTGVVEEFIGNIFTGRRPIINNGLYSASSLISAWTNVCLSPSSVKENTYNPAGTKYIANKRGRILFAKYAYKHNLLAGFYQVQILINGVPAGSTKILSSLDNAGLVIMAGKAADDSYHFDANNSIEVRLNTDTGVPTNNNAKIELYGIFY
jgi:hypothetical protein